MKIGDLVTTRTEWWAERSRRRLGRVREVGVVIDIEHRPGQEPRINVYWGADEFGGSIEWDWENDLEVVTNMTKEV